MTTLTMAVKSAGHKDKRLHNAIIILAKELGFKTEDETHPMDIEHTTTLALDDVDPIHFIAIICNIILQKEDC